MGKLFTIEKVNFENFFLFNTPTFTAPKCFLCSDLYDGDIDKPVLSLYIYRPLEIINGGCSVGKIATIARESHVSIRGFLLNSIEAVSR